MKSRNGPTFFLTLDLECDFGTARTENTYEAASHLGSLLEVLEPRDVPLTVFLQTEVLDEVPDVVATLESASIPVEVHAHSHSHPERRNADTRREIETSVGRVREVFDTKPMGYRFPNGTMADGDYRLLADTDVDFDASVFPSFFPGRFNNLGSPKEPFVHDSGVVEIPFSVYSGFLPIPISLSYLKLLGRPFETLVSKNPPKSIVFDMHMHDLVVPETSDLSIPYRFAYERNRDRGLEIIRRLLNVLAQGGHDFGQLSDLYATVTTASESTHGAYHE